MAMDNQLSLVFDEDTEELHFSDEMKEVKPQESDFDAAIEAIESAKRLAAELEEQAEDAFGEGSQEITVGGQVRTKYARDTYLVRKIMDNIAIVENPATKDTHEICLKDLMGV